MNRQTITLPASTSTSESAPKATSATDPAAMPPPSATGELDHVPGVEIGVSVSSVIRKAYAHVTANRIRVTGE